MIFLRKFTLVIAEILLFLLVTVLLVRPEYMTVATDFIVAFDETTRLIVAIVIDLLLFFAIIAQLRDKPRFRGEGLLVQAGDSNTTLTEESVRLGVKKAIYGIDDIETVETSVQGKGGKAIISMDVETSRDDINIPEKQKEIDRAIKRVVVKQMGVKLSKPARIQIKLASEAQGSPTPPPVTKTPTEPKPISPAPQKKVESPVPLPAEAEDVKTEAIPGAILLPQSPEEIKDSGDETSTTDDKTT